MDEVFIMIANKLPGSLCLLLANLLISSAIQSVTAQELVVNEFQAINNNTLPDNFGEYDDWIEIYNGGAVAADLNGYYLTDDQALRTKSRLKAAGGELTLQPGQYVILWADGDTNQGSNHLSFRISGDGGQIALYDPSVIPVDFVTYGPQQGDISLGREISNFSSWKFYPEPTPGEANTTAPVNGFSEKPAFSETSGVKYSPFQLSINTSNSSDAIYYSLNAESPDSSSLTYLQPLSVSNTQVIRAAAYHQNLERSELVSEFYLFDRPQALPVMAIITDSSNLWGSKGIYTNWNRSGLEWERFVQVKYIENNSLSRAFNAGIRIQGASSVGMPKKSFRFFFRSEYGEGRLQYPIFNDDNFLSFNNLILKSGYDDDLTTPRGTLLRDVLSNELWARCGGIPTLSSWTAVYLNDAYWGIYNIRENINEEYIADHTRYADFDLIRFTYEQPELRYGSMDRWNAWIRFIRENDLSTEGNFRKLEEEMDMDYFINLMAFTHCTSYYSWGWGVSAFAEKNPAGKWRFTTWDADRSFTWADTSIFENTLYEWADIIPFKLLQNEGFTRKFINRTCDLLNTVFIPERSIAVLDKQYDRIRPAIPGEVERWDADPDWESRVEYLREFLRRRPEVLRQQLPQKFGLGESRELSLKIEGNGTVRVNSLYINEKEWFGSYFEGNPIELEAIPAKGYVFSGWERSDTRHSITLDLQDDLYKTAVFSPDFAATKTVIISEISYLSPSGTQPGDWIELHNPGINPVDMSRWTISDNNVFHSFLIPSDTWLQPGAYLVLAEDKNLFQSRYPQIISNITGDFGNGSTGFGLNSMAETIILRDASGNRVDSVAYMNQYPWPVIMSAQYGSIQVRNTDRSNDDPSNWWFLTEAFITPGESNTETYVRGTPEENHEDLFTAYPNPFRDYIAFDYTQTVHGYGEAKIIDLDGKTIITLYKGNISPGDHHWIWDGRDMQGQKVKPGFYILVVRTNYGIKLQKLILCQ